MIKSRILVFITLLLATMVASAQIGGPIQSKRQRTIKTVKKTPQARVSTKNLAYKITRNCNSEHEKTEAIFNWIASNISYDHELRNSTALQSEFYTSEEKVLSKVLERRKALCGGYAFLFKDLCAQVGIKSKVVHGFSKKYSARTRRGKSPEHTWNAVRINNSWHVLDLTLAVSHSKNGKPNMHWFKTEPRFFIKNHYPEDLKWSLLNGAI